MADLRWGCFLPDLRCSALRSFEADAVEQVVYVAGAGDPFGRQDVADARLEDE